MWNAVCIFAKRQVFFPSLEFNHGIQRYCQTWQTAEGMCQIKSITRSNYSAAAHPQVKVVNELFIHLANDYWTWNGLQG